MKYVTASLLFILTLVSVSVAVKTGYILFTWDSESKINLYDHDSQSQCRYHGIAIPKLSESFKITIQTTCIVATEVQTLSY